VTRRKKGIALAGGGPLGGIWELGALVALDEALIGFEPTDCDVYVGVSSGGFIAAGLANGISPREMHRMFIESDAADDPFEPDLLLRPALSEYLQRLGLIPELMLSGARRYLEAPWSRGLLSSFQDLARALPTGVFDNVGIRDYLAHLLSGPGRTNDFRKLERKLFVVATDLDSGEVVPFGAPGWDDVPIARAVVASAALPGLFPPVRIRGRHYVDGALVKTLHASVALREGADLLLCINPIVPFNADLAARSTQARRKSLIEGGLPVVLAQTFRSLVYSRMRVGMERYRKEFPDSDVVLFQPSRDDAEMFFTNVFSYSARRRLSEHAYQQTRADLRRRATELAPILARHGIKIDRAALKDTSRTLAGSGAARLRHTKLGRATLQLDRTLDTLSELLHTRRTRAENMP
jgi:predicted acylesterase/phospholipase RssA